MNEDRELQWDDTITNDGQDCITLPEGDYAFTVESFERGRHNGSEKLPPCNKAIIHLLIETPQGNAVIQHQLFLHSKTEGMLSAFFTAIGQKKKGEKITMNWNAVTGAKGRCRVYVDTWKGSDGEERKSNRVRRFYEPEEAKETKPAGFTPGRF